MSIPVEYLEAGFEAFRQGLSKKYPLVPSPAIELAAFTLTSIALDGNKDADSAKHLMLSLEAMNTPDED